MFSFSDYIHIYAYELKANSQLTQGKSGELLTHVIMMYTIQYLALVRVLMNRGPKRLQGKV